MAFQHSTTGEEVADRFSNQIDGKVILLTGATWGGLGAETVRILSKHNPRLVIMAGRKQEALDETISKIRQETPNVQLRALLLDLGSLDSIKEAAAQVNKYSENIDVLINNAGVMASPYFTTKDGFEGQFGTNHLGPFYFTQLILPKLLLSKEPRVVNVSSAGHYFSPILFEDPDFSNGKTYKKWLAYGQSKTANILFAKELSNRYKSQGLTAFSLHPGTITTNLWRHVDFSEIADEDAMLDYQGQNIITEFFLKHYPTEAKTLSQGSATTLAAAFDPTIKDKSGLFLNNANVDIEGVKPYALDDEEAKKLWELSELLIVNKL